MKYPREAIVAAIGADNDGEFRPIDTVLNERGVHPYIAQVASEVAITLSEQFGKFANPDVIEPIGEVGFLRGFLTGLSLGENEQRVAEAILAYSAQTSGAHYTKNRLPDPVEFTEFEKVGSTRMARMNGTFTCETIDGNIVGCDDGWLAIDADGYPYPVADAVARKSYAIPAPPL